MSTFLLLEGGSRAFRRDTKLVEGQLAGSKGLVGYALRVKFLRRHYWTLSVWEEETDLMAFKEAPPHRDMLAPRKWRLGAFKSARWRIPGANVPPGWEEALKRLGQG